MVSPAPSSSSSSSSSGSVPSMHLKLEQKTLDHISTHYNDNKGSRGKIISELKAECLTQTEGVSKTWNPKHRVNKIGISPDGNGDYIFKTHEEASIKKGLFSSTKVIIPRTFKVSADVVNNLALKGEFGAEIKKEAETAKIVQASRQRESKQAREKVENGDKEVKESEMKDKVEALRRDALGPEGRFAEDLGKCVEEIGKDNAKDCSFLRSHKFPVGTKSKINSFEITDKGCRFEINEHSGILGEKPKTVFVEVANVEMQKWHESYLKSR